MDDDLAALPDHFEQISICCPLSYAPPPGRIPPYFDQFHRVGRGFRPEVFRLFDLPPEIWLHICHLAVLQDSTIESSGHNRSLGKGDVRQPAITRTCRVLRREILPLFYRDNHFRYRRRKAGFIGLRCWLHNIGPANREAVGRVQFGTGSQTINASTFMDDCYTIAKRTSEDLIVQAEKQKQQYEELVIADFRKRCDKYFDFAEPTEKVASGVNGADAPFNTETLPSTQST